MVETTMKRKNKYLIGIVLLIVLYFLYKYSPYKLDYIGHYDKIWAHRIDDQSRLKSAIKYFKGVEVDLVYNSEKNYLDVGHPPAKSIGLSLDKYLSNLTNKKPYIWLDIKNLNITNAVEIHALLEKLCKKYQYPKDKFLVETRYPEALPIFTKNDFICTYYLPYHIYKREESEKQKILFHINEILKAQPTIGVSAAYKDYDILHKNFPTKNKYMWIIESTRNRKLSLTRKILKDSTVKVVLISYHTLKKGR